MRRQSRPAVDGPVREDPAIAGSVIDDLLPAGHAEAEWSVREVARLAVHARLAGDIAGAMAAHRLLADVLDASRGGYAKRRAEEAIDVAEQERVILEAADEIRAKRSRFQT